MSFSITQAISISLNGTQDVRCEVYTLCRHCRIHDVKRNVLGVYDGKKTGVLHLGEQPVTVFLDRKEDDFLRLWRTYYDSVNIAERKNERLMNACMPKRYHKNLPEKNRVTE